MKICIIQPPLLQHNAPYPSGAYLSAFFKDAAKNTLAGCYSEHDVRWIDLNNVLFHRLYSADGLHLLFSQTEKKALALAENAAQCNDTETAFNLRRYIAQQDEWSMRIDSIVQMLCGGGSGREFAHEFVRSAHIPRGRRMEQFLASLAGDVSVDDAHILGTLAVADIADYITVVADEHYSLVRYAESLATSTSDFSAIEKTLDSFVFRTYLEPELESLCTELEADAPEGAQNLPPYLLCISVPFPGTLSGALFCARYVRKKFGNRALISLGGGYINTELRSTQEKKLFAYTDMLDYDRGYASYTEVFRILKEARKERTDEHSFADAAGGKQLYKIRYLHNGAVIPQKEDDEALRSLDDSYTRRIIPDYSAVDFARYPRLSDDTNPMHRMWSDGAWLKAYLAHGCYWHRCAFCDTTLDYVQSYIRIDATSLCRGLSEQAAAKGVCGIHFTDEASPPASLVQFALENCRLSSEPNKKNKRLSFWGNIRFERVFSRDIADFLSYGGLTGVSGGIEIAANTGLSCINKGTSIEDLVAACCAFKEAGILVHAYMIYGFWQETPQMLIDSMETLRQLFAAGLLDSAFWHKFVLTSHSTAYAQWKSGEISDLQVCDTDKSAKPFASNTLQFKGEQKAERYTQPLETALAYWMQGEELNRAVTSWFPFKMPHPSVDKNYIEKNIAQYERKRDADFRKTTAERGGRLVWLGGKPFTAADSSLSWMYMGEMQSIHLAPQTTQQQVSELLCMLSALRPEAETFDTTESLCTACTALQTADGRSVIQSLRGRGLCRLPHY